MDGANFNVGDAAREAAQDAAQADVSANPDDVANFESAMSSGAEAADAVGDVSSLPGPAEVSPTAATEPGDLQSMIKDVQELASEHMNQREVINEHFQRIQSGEATQGDYLMIAKELHAYENMTLAIAKAVKQIENGLRTLMTNQ